MKVLLLFCGLFGASYAQFSSAAQADIVKAHNDFRSTIAKGGFQVQGVEQPGAANMLKMKWSSKLATSAQNYVNSCPEAKSGSDVGESFYWAWNEISPNNLNIYGKEAALSWKDEFETFGLTSTLFDQQALDSGISHASQMAWALTGFVGCGVKNCGPDQDRFDQAFKIVVVCQYLERGNVVDENIYEPGDTCSACPDFTQCEDSSGLCI